jgi:hypothetical protein
VSWRFNREKEQWEFWYKEECLEIQTTFFLHWRCEVEDKYRVRCWFHHYDTLHTLSHGTAVTAARMHAMIGGCTRVEVTDKDGKQIDWHDASVGPKLPEK